MDMNDYIRKAVELADNIWPWDYHKTLNTLGLNQIELDALSAQLVRQVEQHDDYVIHAYPRTTSVVQVTEKYNEIIEKTLTSGFGLDRTMNTIKAIVDSGVLEHG